MRPSFATCTLAWWRAVRAALHLAVARLDVGLLARQQRANLEAQARAERYRWLAEVATGHGLTWVATGHTANDQAETVLHRLLRGTGLAGLRGIGARRPCTATTDVAVVRPMLAVTRAEVLAYPRRTGPALPRGRQQLRPAAHAQPHPPRIIAAPGLDL